MRDKHSEEEERRKSWSSKDPLYKKRNILENIERERKKTLEQR